MMRYKGKKNTAFPSPPWQVKCPVIKEHKKIFYT